MCDTIVVVEPGRVLFAKNSDRDANEAQFLQWLPQCSYPIGQKLKCTWIEIPQVRQTHAILISRPFWIWGAEMGANEHGVVIGNEAVFTREPLTKKGLVGMDLLRLALERAATAQQAVETIIELLETFGQGGGCGHEDRRFSYHNSFLVADSGGAVVLETAGGKWTTEQVQGARSISNNLSIPDFRARHSDFLYTRVAQGEARRAITQDLAMRAEGVADMMAILRNHKKPGVDPSYTWLNGAMSAPCMHAGGLATGSQTTGSWVSELTPNQCRHWVTGTAAPCTSLFKPVAVDQHLDLGPRPEDRFDPATLWWRHEVLHRAVMADPKALMPLIIPERDRVESRWLSDPPEPGQAFAQGNHLLSAWTKAVAQTDIRDRRPWFVRRFWNIRNRRAGLSRANDFL